MVAANTPHLAPDRLHDFLVFDHDTGARNKDDTMNLTDIFAEEEARRLADARAEIARERAEWAALSDEEKAAITAAYEEKYAAFDDLPDDDEIKDDEEEFEE